MNIRKYSRALCRLTNAIREDTLSFGHIGKNWPVKNWFSTGWFRYVLVHAGEVTK